MTRTAHVHDAPEGTRRLRRRSLLAAALAFVLAALLVPATASAEWRQYHGDVHRSGQAAWQGGGLPGGTVAWSSAVAPDTPKLRRGPVEGPPERAKSVVVDASPVVGPDGTVYLGTWDPEAGGADLVAFEPNGSRRWEIDLGEWHVPVAPAVRFDGWILVHALRFETIYEGQEPGDGVSSTTFDDTKEIAGYNALRKLFLVAPAGEVVWQSPVFDAPGWGETDTAAISTPLAADSGDEYLWNEGSVNVVGPGLQLSGLHVASPVITGSGPGLISWETLVCGVPGVGQAYCTMVSSMCGELVCEFDPDPVYLPRARVHVGPGVTWGCGDLVAAGSAGAEEKLARLRPWGKKLWVKDVAVATTPAVGRYGTAYYGTAGGKLEAREQDGKVAWSLDLGAPVIQTVGIGTGEKEPDDPVSPSCVTETKDGATTSVGGPRDHRAARDRIYAAAANGNLYAIDHMGRTLWSRHLADTLAGAPVVVRDPRTGAEIVIVGTDRKTIVALGGDGGIHWTVALDGPALGSPAVSDGHVYVATATRLYAID